MGNKSHSRNKNHPTLSIEFDSDPSEQHQTDIGSVGSIAYAAGQTIRGVAKVSCPQQEAYEHLVIVSQAEVTLVGIDFCEARYPDQQGKGRRKVGSKYFHLVEIAKTKEFLRHQYDIASNLIRDSPHGLYSRSFEIKIPEEVSASQYFVRTVMHYRYEDFYRFGISYRVEVKIKLRATDPSSKTGSSDFELKDVKHINVVKPSAELPQQIHPANQSFVIKIDKHNNVLGSVHVMNPNIRFGDTLNIEMRINNQSCDRYVRVMFMHSLLVMLKGTGQEVVEFSLPVDHVSVPINYHYNESNCRYSVRLPINAISTKINPRFRGANLVYPSVNSFGPFAMPPTFDGETHRIEHAISYYFQAFKTKKGKGLDGLPKINKEKPFKSHLRVIKFFVERSQPQSLVPTQVMTQFRSNLDYQASFSPMNQPVQHLFNPYQEPQMMQDQPQTQSILIPNNNQTMSLIGRDTFLNNQASMLRVSTFVDPQTSQQQQMSTYVDPHTAQQSLMSTIIDPQTVQMQQQQHFSQFEQLGLPVFQQQQQPQGHVEAMQQYQYGNPVLLGEDRLGNMIEEEQIQTNQMM